MNKVYVVLSLLSFSFLFSVFIYSRGFKSYQQFSDGAFVHADAKYFRLDGSNVTFSRRFNSIGYLRGEEHLNLENVPPTAQVTVRPRSAGNVYGPQSTADFTTEKLFNFAADKTQQKVVVDAMPLKQARKMAMSLLAQIKETLEWGSSLSKESKIIFWDRIANSEVHMLNKLARFLKRMLAEGEAGAEELSRLMSVGLQCSEHQAAQQEIISKVEADHEQLHVSCIS